MSTISGLRVPREASNDVPTPHLVLDLDRIGANVKRLRAAFATLQPKLSYAVKTNGDPRVLSILRDLGCGFDVASISEVRRVQMLGIPGSRISFGAPVKVPSHIEEAYERGIDCYAFDSPTEVAKLARYAPGARVILRVEVSQEGSCWPLGGKFGAPYDQALDLLLQAQRSGLRPHGLTFHVGSQCLRPESWSEAIGVCGRIWSEARAQGIDLRLANLGGGFPSRYTVDVPEFADVGRLAAGAALQAFGPDAEFVLEPGRSLVADAGTLVTSVIGKAVRHGKPWMFVDLSVFAGLLEALEGWTYPIRTAKDDQPKQSTTLAGPSCDSTDILARDVELPDLEVGDRLELMTAGAYTTSYREYNGFAFPDVVLAPRKTIRSIRAA